MNRRAPPGSYEFATHTLPPLAVDAKLQLKSAQGARVVAAGDFFQDLFTVDLAADEIITAIRFAPVRTAAYAKLYQRASRFAIVGVAAALDVTAGAIRAARIGLTGAVSHAVRLTAGEEALVGCEATVDAPVRWVPPAPVSRTSMPTSTRARPIVGR